MDRLPILFHPDANEETVGAYHWYRDRSEKAAEAFLYELERAGHAIKESPQQWPEYLFGTRRYLLKRFPFIIVYRVSSTRIEILAVAHGRRRPGYWRDRTS